MVMSSANMIFQSLQQCLTAATTTTTPTTKTFQIPILSCYLLSIFGLQGCEVVGHIVVGPDHQVGHLRQHVNLAFSAKTKILFSMIKD
jgi:hypothetical protein